MLLRLTGMPAIPFKPVPLIKLSRIVSVLSFAICAVAILLKPFFLAIRSSSLYLSFLPASSTDNLFFLANAFTFLKQRNIQPYFV
jgi:hypothetical protein